MLDPAILHSLQARFPPEQPAIVEEQVWRSVAGEQAERIGRRMADSFDKAADEWIASMDRARLDAEHARIESAAAAEDIALLTGVIDDFEAMADLRARRGAKLERRLRREVKAAFRGDPSVAAAKRAFGQRLVATEKRVIDALLDYALFLRAIRTEIDPGARGGPTFDSSQDLERHLTSLGAA